MFGISVSSTLLIGTGILVGVMVVWMLRQRVARWIHHTIQNFLHWVLAKLGTGHTTPTTPANNGRVDVFGAGDLVEEILFYGLPATIVILPLFVGFAYGAPLALLAGVYWFLSLRVVDTTERAVKLLFKKPYTTCESGLRWAPFLIGSLEPRTTNIVTLDFEDTAGVFTRQGKARDAEGNEITNGRVYGSINLGLTVSVLFQWPKDDLLIDAVVKLPATKEGLVDLLEEPVLEQIRTTGGDTVWINLVQRRAHFAKEVRNSLVSETDSVVGSILKETGLDRTFQIALKHIDIPADVKGALTAQEKAELERAGALIDADTKRRTTVLEGSGIARAKAQLLRVLRSHPENAQSQALLTLIEMAQGPATTIFPLSTDLTNVLGKVIRGDSSGNTDVDGVLRMLTPEQRKVLLGMLQSAMAPKGGEK